MCGLTRLDRIRNECIRGSLGITTLAGKMRENGLRWFRNVEKRKNNKLAKNVSELVAEVEDEVRQRKSGWWLSMWK